MGVTQYPSALDLYIQSGLNDVEVKVFVFQITSVYQNQVLPDYAVVMYKGFKGYCKCNRKVKKKDLNRFPLDISILQMIFDYLL